MKSKLPPLPFVFPFYSSSQHWHPAEELVNVRNGLTKKRTSKSSAFASFTASARIAFTSNGVKDVPPPRGKSTSSVKREDPAVVEAGGRFLLLPGLSVLDFLAFGLDAESSKVRFWAGIFAVLIAREVSDGNQSRDVKSNESQKIEEPDRCRFSK